jgi:tetratricopeptide (TPR) repeat protein
VFARIGDHAGRARAENAIAIAHLSACRWDEAAAARRREIDHARRAGEKGLELRAIAALAYAVLFGPTPVDEALIAVTQLREEARGYPSAEGGILGVLGLLAAMRGEFDRAREFHQRSAELLGDLGPALPVGEAALNAGESELLAGDPAAAEAHLRPALEALDKAGETAIMASVAAVLADAVHLQGRADEADALVERCQAVAADDDVAVQAGLRGTRAKVLAGRGEPAEAERLAREAVALAEGTDDLNLRAGTILNLGEVLGASGDAQPAVEVTETALDLYRRKGNRPAAERALAAADRQRLRSSMQ